MAQGDNDTKYLPELQAEKDSIDPSFVHAGRLLESEITKLKSPKNDSKEENGGNTTNYTESDFVDCFAQKMPKIECYIKVPANEYPAVNFVGRLIGPGGSTLKGIQEITRTRIAVLGKGSQRDKKKAEEMAESGDPKWAHMKLPLHVKISAVGPVDQCYMGVGRACTEIMKLLQVDDEEAQGMGMGMNPMQGMAGRGRGGPRGRGPSSRGMNTRGGRGGTGQSRGGNRGGGARDGASSARGRGNGASTRGSRGNNRGNNTGGGSRFGQKSAGPAAAAQQSQQMMQPDMSQQGYGQEAYQGYDQYSAGGAEMYSDPSAYEYADPNAYGGEAYAAEGYAADGSYATGQEQYDMSGYGAGYGEAAYADYGNGAGDQSQYGGTPQQSKPYRGKMQRGTNNRGNARAAGKPY